MRTERLSRWLVASAAVALVACGGAASSTASPTPQADVGSGQLQGAGATFPGPYYDKAFFTYNQKYSQVAVNYQAIGSGGGIQQFTAGTVDFGASDVPMTDAEVQTAGVGASGNQGVGQQVKSTEGAIGYVELAYVQQTRLQSATLKNKAGKWVAASLDGATAAAAGLANVSPANFSITDADGAGAYPIATYTWIIVRKNQTDANKGKAVVNLLKWVVTDGQSLGKDLSYPALPKDSQSYAPSQLQQVTSAGKPILG